MYTYNESVIKLFNGIFIVYIEDSVFYKICCIALLRLFGCYEALDGGELSEALEDFTGGVSVTVNMVKLNLANDAQERAALFTRMQKEAGRKALMAASIPVSILYIIMSIHLLLYKLVTSVQHLL